MLFEDLARARSFGAGAALYDRARPSYPRQLIDALMVDEPRRVLDVGCGTGIAGALLAERGCAVVGVEVDRRMAELAQAKEMLVEVAAFEDWDAGGRCFDLVVSGQAWHWIEPARGTARAADLLVPGGRLGVFWNLGDPPAKVRELLAPIYARLEPELENYSVVLGHRHRRVQATVGEIGRAGRFAGTETTIFPWTKTYQTVGWLEHLETHSDHRALPTARRERLLTAVGEAIEAVGGSFEMPYEAVLVSARRA